MTPPAGPPLLALGAGGRATVTLNRPQHLNRLHREDLLALQDHLARIAADPGVRVLVLTGSGRAFCAGFHLGELDESEDSASADPRLFEHTVDALEALAVPTIARLNGSVFGGATDLALACDFRIGVQGMQLRMPAARLGLHYYASGLQRFVSRLGLAAAKRLFLLAETLAADELLRIGYLDTLVPPERLDAEVDTLAATLAGHAPLALRGMKQSLNEIARGGFDPARLREREAACAASADLREGLAAFAAKREPQFNGR
ncbi:MAG: enoyl-CoA hydratase/isomerase family protein [Betaproteobacteria bacterium]|nr:enoyl-CoA hydratase/isomerase family protein [Betaproteobacteria bacterium]